MATISETKVAPAQSTMITHQPAESALAGFWLRICAMMYRYLCEFIFIWFRFLDRKFWAAQKADRNVTYPVRSMLTHHVFIPSSHRPGQKHAVYVLIHGVAWIIGSPSMDDAQARFLADQHDYVVVTVGYRRAPEHRFPTAIFDVEAVIGAILKDTSLPIDTNKLVVGGFSAGATIALAVAQLPSLQNRIKALVTFQPLVDQSRSVRGPYREKMPWGLPDDMEKTKTLSDWAFPAAGQDLRDRLLSPYHASREEIPQPLCIITGGADMLCQEDCLMAGKLADRKINKSDYEKDWEQNGVKYWCAVDMPHGWTHYWVQLKGEWKNKQMQKREEAWQQVTSWLSKTLKA